MMTKLIPSRLLAGKSHCRPGARSPGLRSSDVRIGNPRVTLVIDLTPPVAYVLNQSLARDLGVMQFLSPSRRVRSQLIPLNDFSPDRVPLVFAHGPFRSPVTWAELNHALLRQRVVIGHSQGGHHRDDRSCGWLGQPVVEEAHA